MSNTVSVIGRLTPPPGMSAGGEHLCWHIEVAKAPANGQLLIGRSVGLNTLPEFGSWAGQRVRLDGVYTGLHGVESKEHHIDATYVGPAPE
jgi:hypothetical protein